MIQTPALCPHCGELLLAWIAGENVMLLPAHPDRVFPFENCAVALMNASTRSRR